MIGKQTPIALLSLGKYYTNIASPMINITVFNKYVLTNSREMYECRKERHVGHGKKEMLRKKGATFNINDIQVENSDSKMRRTL